MDPLLAIGLFVGIPVALALVITIAIMVPQRYGSGDVVADEVADGLITSSPAAPNPAALPSANAPRVQTTGGAHGSW